MDIMRPEVISVAHQRDLVLGASDVVVAYFLRQFLRP
jgi:hypothetical protein